MQTQGRLPQTFIIRGFSTIITSIFVILCFQLTVNVPEGTLVYEDYQNRRAALFYVCMTLAFNAVQSVILVFPDERPVFLKEVNNNFYSSTAYFFAKIISEIPASCITPFIFGCICYFSIHLDTSAPEKFPIFGNSISSLSKYSWYYNPCVPCISESLLHYLHTLCRQTTLRHSYSSYHHSLHDVRWVLH